MEEAIDDLEKLKNLPLPSSKRTETPSRCREKPPQRCENFNTWGDPLFHATHEASKEFHPFFKSHRVAFIEIMRAIFRIQLPNERFSGVMQTS
jgi:hypothetical protein